MSDLLEETGKLSQGEKNDREGLKKDFLKATLLEEVLWRQRFRVNWLKEGDRNTNFFHKVVSHLKNSKEILGLYINGRWSQDQREIINEIENFYEKLYKEDQVVRLGLDGMKFERISSTNRIMLERRFSKDEVWNVLSIMKGDKSLGLDGFSISFF